MAIKFVFVLLGALLLVHNVYTAPAASSSSEESNENIFKGLIERFKLLALTLDELVSIHKLIAEKGTDVVKKVLEDPKVNEIKTETMKEYLKKLQDFQDKLGKGTKQTESKIFEFLDEFGDIVQKFDHEKNENMSEEAEIIEKSLKENGLTDLRNTIREHFTKFIEQFTKEYDSYVARLTEAEKKGEEELIAWVDKLKAEKDVEKQFDIFDAFFKEFDNSSNSSDD